MWRNLDELVSDIRKKAIDIGAAELAIVQQVTLISKVLLELEMQHGYSYSDIMKDYKKRTLEETVVWLKGLYQKLTLEIKGRSNYRHYKLITELKYYIDQHLQDDISLEMLAEKAELSPSYLSSLFKEMLHLSFSEYLNEARLKNEAKRLLEDRSVDAGHRHYVHPEDG